ncbi:MAG TPA: Ig-like domain-containing protein, partial [Planctomycetota bacterium]|nr:Ig-like domain-containing protein [Planctomycetota bacterium]
MSQPSCEDGTGGGTGSSSFCVVACNLGCGPIGCAISEIAQNQPITFEFNRPVDPASVNFTTIQMKTETGEEPVGQFLVSGNRVTFVPEIQVVGNSSFFGFKNGATYSLIIRRGGEGPTVRSVSGQPMVRGLTCSLRVSRGIVDLDNAPPRATLVTPSVVTNVPRDTRIVLEFSEILDRAPFQTTNEEDRPVRFLVRRTVNNNGVLECDTSSELPLRGAQFLDQDPARQISVLTMVPGDRLPSQACIEIQVTTRVRDVAGVAARPQLFRFTIEEAALVRRTLVESFSSQQTLDPERSAGEWSGGSVSPAQIGGSGRHGDFSLDLLERVGANDYLWDLDRDEVNGRRGFLIPGSRTLSGEDELVTDGAFEFAMFVLPDTANVRVVGSSPLRLWVRGRCEIGGVLDLAGRSAAVDYPARPSIATMLAGQPASPGGPGGGEGGRGGSLEPDMGTPGNPNKPAFDGMDGGAGWVHPDHAYLNLAQARGGAGSRQWPASGLNTDIVFSYLGVVSQMAPSPGGGGGWVTPGGTGSNLSIPAHLRQADTAGGGGFDPLALPPLGRESAVHFLLGGAGGGGGGAHTYFRALGEPMLWCAGGAGGGGGGALLVRVGRDLLIKSNAFIDARGGDGSTVTDTQRPLVLGPANPGGGGSGGTVLLQVAGNYDLLGRVRVTGGNGADIEYNYHATPGVGDRLVLHAGDGSPGYVRVEAPVAPSPQ